MAVRTSRPIRSNRSRHNFVIAQLRALIPAGNQHLRTWMIERYQQSSVPAANSCGVSPEREFMIMNPLECLKRDRSQRHDYVGIYQGNHALKKVRTVSNFTGGGSPVGARNRTWIAQRRTRDENLRPF